MRNEYFDEIDFKGLKKYIQDPDVTDIHCRNNKEVWVTSNKKGHYKIQIKITKEDIFMIANQVANKMEKEFNPSSPCLEGEISGKKTDIRISAIHPHLSVSGTSLALRKVSKQKKLEDDYLLKTDYITQEGLNFLKWLVQGNANILIVGETGSGKTELLKYLATHIPSNQVIATIEDSLEFNIKEIHPSASCSAFRVKKEFDYASVIAMCLRQNIDWILLQEARGSEVNDLLEAMSTGHSVMTTMHAKGSKEVSIRVKQMLHDSSENIESIKLRLYSLVDAVIYIRKKQIPYSYRYIEDIVIYQYDEKTHQCINHEVYKAGEKMKAIPKFLKEKLQ
ncbi:MAG: ATPase, T2SS/T4P/T4SS family [Erysipelotrichaceae bacterium]